MCLTKTHKLPKISRKPIQVYKAFNYSITDCVLITPYLEKRCKVGDIIKAKHSWLKGIFKNKIGAEGVHAYTNILIAKWYKDPIYICVIPPFTPYWIGEDDDIAASKMIIKRRVYI